MIVDSRYKPELIANETQSSARISLQYVNIVETHAGVSVDPNWRGKSGGLDERPGLVVATNGRILLVFPCILEKGDVLGVLRADAFKYARQFRKKASGNLTIKLGHRNIAIGREKFIMSRRLRDSEGELKYPNTNFVLPNDNSKLPEAITKIAFTTKLLNLLIAAMGNPEGILFKFNGEHFSVIVRPENDNSVLGVIMPRVV